MTPGRKFAMVAVGYGVAILLASMAVALRVASSGPEEVAESGMRAFGDLVVFIGVFGACAFVPTAAGLYFLRPYRKFWDLLGFAALALAVTAVSAAFLFGLREQSGPAAFAVLRLLGSPLLTCGFLLSALLSPFRAPRIALFCAFALEGAAFLYAVLVMSGKIGAM